MAENEPIPQVFKRSKMRAVFETLRSSLWLCAWILLGTALMIMAAFLLYPTLDAARYSDQMSPHLSLYASKSHIAPKTIAVKRDAASEVNLGYKHGIMELSAGDGDMIVYAYDLVSDWPHSGAEYELQSVAEPGLTYLINNAFPFSRLYGPSDIDQYISQFAIWRYLSDCGYISRVDESPYTTDKEAYLGIQNEIVKLRNASWYRRSYNSYLHCGYGYEPVYIYANPENPQADRLVVAFRPDRGGEDL